GPNPPGGSPPPRPPSPPAGPAAPHVGPPSAGGPGSHGAQRPPSQVSLGSLSQKYESGGDPGRVSSGYLNKAHTKEDRGGVSYGAYQFTSRYNDKHGAVHEGTVQSFLKSSSGKRWEPEFRDEQGRP